LEPRRILITGANGFVGRHLIAHLEASFGDTVSVIAAVRPEDMPKAAITAGTAGWNGSTAPNLCLVPFDTLHAAQAVKQMRQFQPTHIIHLAARSSGADNDRDAIRSVNVDGTRNVLEAASLITPFPRVLVISTGYVYGSTEPGRAAREEDPIGPLWRYGPYTDSKIEMESVARNYRAFAIIVRPFSHTGPGQPPHFAVPGFARQIARIERGTAEPMLTVGNLNTSRDFLDVRDVVRAYTALLDTGKAGEVYNVATGQPVVIRDILDRMRAMSRVATEVVVDVTRFRPSEIECSSGDSLRLWTETNWSPRKPLDTTQTDTQNNWRSQTS
jgi:GDP-4-dehydro-6-deoxy-D-mannose reductase